MPKLRFPEFRDSGEWEPKKLGDKGVSEFPNKRVPHSELSLDSYVSTENIRPDYKGLTRASKLPPSGSFTAYKKGDILIANIRPYLKKITVASENGSASNDVVVVRPMDRVKPLFLSPLLQNDVFISYVMKGAKGVKMPRGDLLQMKEYSIAIPGPKEQQKIADCLSSLDTLIDAQTDKIDALKAHKKGLMQQLFPREGETVPQLRFPEFRNVRNWDMKPLREICNLQAGKFVRANEIYGEADKGKYSCYGGNGLRGYTNSYTHSGTYSLIGRQGALCGNVNLASGKFHATEHAVVASPLHDIDTKWLFYQLTEMNLNQHATGQAQPGLSVDNLNQLEVRMPSKEKEQKKIAECLFSLDTLITEQTQKIGVLRAHRKGLMQQLFPSPGALV